MFCLDGPMNMALPNSEARAPNLPQAGPNLGVVDEEQETRMDGTLW